MKDWQDEFLAESHRQDIWKQVEQIRLERLALEARGDCPTLFERSMLTFGNWMISKGRQLRKRYEASTGNCSNPPPRSFAMKG